MKIKITSSSNPRVRELKKLQDKKFRNASGTFLIEGLRFVREARLQNAEILNYIVEEDRPEILQDAGVPDDATVYLVGREILKEIAGTVTPQGIMATVRIPESVTTEDFLNKGGLWLYLDEIRDPGNLGTIIRTAHGFAFDGLILAKGCADPFQDKVLRSTMGSIFRVPLVLNAGPQLLQRSVDAGFSLYLTDLEDSGALKDIHPEERSIVVIGNEARGVQESIKAIPHRNLRIPMPGGSESLNAAVAASIIMYEFKGRD